MEIPKPQRLMRVPKRLWRESVAYGPLRANKRDRKQASGPRFGIASARAHVEDVVGGLDGELLAADADDDVGRCGVAGDLVAVVGFVGRGSDGGSEGGDGLGRTGEETRPRVADRTPPTRQGRARRPQSVVPMEVEERSKVANEEEVRE